MREYDRVLARVAGYDYFKGWRFAPDAECLARSMSADRVSRPHPANPRVLCVGCDGAGMDDWDRFFEGG